MFHQNVPSQSSLKRRSHKNSQDIERLKVVAGIDRTLSSSLVNLRHKPSPTYNVLGMMTRLHGASAIRRVKKRNKNCPFPWSDLTSTLDAF